MWQSIKSGAWFTPARARVYPLTLLIAVVTIAAVWIALADNLVDRMGKPTAPIFPTSGLPASSCSKANPGHRTIPPCSTRPNATRSAAPTCRSSAGIIRRFF